MFNVVDEEVSTPADVKVSSVIGAVSTLINVTVSTVAGEAMGTQIDVTVVHKCF